MIHNPITLNILRSTSQSHPPLQFLVLRYASWKALAIRSLTSDNDVLDLPTTVQKSS